MPARILVVDDSPITRIMLREMLDGGGHTVVAEAADLETTLSAYEAHKPDIVTLDLSLAEGDGVAVLKALRAKDPRSKVIVISANAQKKVVEEVLASGAAAYLEKPILMNQLVALATRLLEEKQKV